MDVAKASRRICTQARHGVRSANIRQTCSFVMHIYMQEFAMQFFFWRCWRLNLSLACSACSEERPLARAVNQTCPQAGKISRRSVEQATKFCYGRFFHGFPSLKTKLCWSPGNLWYFFFCMFVVSTLLENWCPHISLKRILQLQAGLQARQVVFFPFRPKLRLVVATLDLVGCDEGCPRKPNTAVLTLQW